MMEKEKIKRLWEKEEEYPLKGWDFSHIEGRCIEEPLPWNYRSFVVSYMRPDTIMLDMGTGGGEFLLSLSPPAGKTYATESYAPNITVAKKALSPHGIVLRIPEDDFRLPFNDDFFDLVINRHESYYLPEVWRVMKPGGIFITQQVGDKNNLDISYFLLGKVLRKKGLPESLKAANDDAKRLGFEILKSEEYFPETRYTDVGAFVYMAKIIEWEFPEFSVDRCFDRLLELQSLVEKNGWISAYEHRYLFMVLKPTKQI